MTSPAQHIQEFHKIGYDVRICQEQVDTEFEHRLSWLSVCVCVHLCMEMYAWPGIPMGREHLGCKPSASILFGTWSLGCCCILQTDDLWTSRNSPVSAFFHLTLGTMGLQIWATVSAFVWILGIKIQPLLLAHVLYPLRRLPGPSHKLPNAFLSLISKSMASWASFFPQPKENTEKGQLWDTLCGCTVHSHPFAWFEMISQGSPPKRVKYSTLIHRALVDQGKCSKVKLWHCVGTWNHKGANIPCVFKILQDSKKEKEAGDEEEDDPGH